MESEVSGIARLGVVLLALAVLIGLGFGIFQISKGTANTGVTRVQSELDGVSESVYTSYDQTIITGTMVRSAMSDFEGESTAILVATQAWVNNLKAAEAKIGRSYEDILKSGSGLSESYAAKVTDKEGIALPIIWAYKDNKLDNGTDNEYKVATSAGEQVHGCFINYNALLGAKAASGKVDIAPGCVSELGSVNGYELNMAGIYFDSNCYRCTSGFATDDTGRVLFNNITGNMAKTGRTEFVPTGAKFQSYLLKDASGTTMGFVLQQSSGN